ncbi:MAG: MarR family transcriptional regulator [Clostridiales bacterium]|jgi:DNA-binding MarR family transcriptional regulator|nr:MarR family transcriptional regulator [Clostridiales bacterium]
MTEGKRLGVEVSKLANSIKRRVSKVTVEVESEFGLTAMQNWCLGLIYRRRGHDIYQRDIEQAFNIRRSTATGILQLLEKNGFLYRVAVECDARLKKIVLTDKALAVCAKMRDILDECEQSFIRGLSEEELAVFYSVMEKIEDNTKE